MSRLFTGRQHPMRGPLVDDRPRSETDPVRPYTDDGRNYLAWLAASTTSSLDIGAAGERLHRQQPADRHACTCCCGTRC